MKTKHILLMAAASLVGLASCSDDSSDYRSNDVLRFNIGISDTRVQSAASGDASTLFEQNDVVTVMSGSQKCDYTFDQNSWKPVAGNTPLLRTGSVMDFVAVYPAGADINTFDIPTDQSTDIAKADYMVGESKACNVGTDANVTLSPLKRKTARIVMNVSFDDAFMGLKAQLSNVKICSNTAVGEGRAEALQWIVTYADGAKIVALVAPTAEHADKDFVTFTVNYGEAKSLNYTVKGIKTATAGMSHNYNLRISMDKAEITSSSISSWVDTPLDNQFPEDKPIESIVYPETNTIDAMPGKITADYVTEALNGGDRLIVKGKINANDITALNDSRIKHLDLSEVRLLNYDNTIGYDLYKEMFQDNKTLQTVQLPQYITGIGENAFCDAVNIKHIDLPGSLTSLGTKSLFAHYFEELDIPAGVTYLGSRFAGWSLFHGMTKFVFRPVKGINIDSGAFGYFEKGSAGSMLEGVADLILDDSWFYEGDPTTDKYCVDVANKTWAGVTWKSITKLSEYEKAQNK